MEAIRKLFPNATAGTPTTGMKRTKATQHAEVTIAIGMISKFSGGIKWFEIGVSKRSCVWCDEWLGHAKQAVEVENFRIIDSREVVIY